MNEDFFASSSAGSDPCSPSASAPQTDMAPQGADPASGPYGPSAGSACPPNGIPGGVMGSAPLFYNGGILLRCPRCGNVVSTRICGFCGSDLAMYYGADGRPLYPQTAAPSLPYTPYPPYGYTGMPPAYHPYAAETKKDSKSVWIAVGLCGLFLAAFIAVILLLSPWIAQRTNSDSGITIPNIDGYYDDFGGNGGDSLPSQENSYPHGISMEELSQLKEGMSYAVVAQIIGGDGVLCEEGTDSQNREYAIYAWGFEANPYAAVYITFTEGRVSNIYTEGLN